MQFIQFFHKSIVNFLLSRLEFTITLRYNKGWQLLGNFLFRQNKHKRRNFFIKLFLILAAGYSTTATPSNVHPLKGALLREYLWIDKLKNTKEITRITLQRRGCRANLHLDIIELTKCFRTFCGISFDVMNLVSKNIIHMELMKLCSNLCIPKSLIVHDQQICPLELTFKYLFGLLLESNNFLCNKLLLFQIFCFIKILLLTFDLRKNLFRCIFRSPNDLGCEIGELLYFCAPLCL